MRSQRSTTARSFRRLRYSVGVLAAGLAAIIGTSSADIASASAAAHTRTAAPARAHHYGVLPLRKGTADVTPSTSSGRLTYHGGPVQHSPSVYLVFWGSQWNSDTNGVESYLSNLFNGLGTSGDSWSRVTSQYTDSSGQGPTFSGAVLRGTWVDGASAAPTDGSASQISSEADRGASHFGASGANVQIVVVSPHGTHPDGFPNTGFCAWHDYDGTVPYTNLPYVLDAGANCGENSVLGTLDGFSIVEGHEYAETLTDPEPPTGYVTSDGYEDGDICAWQGLGAINLPTGAFAMQPTWSNSLNRCSMT
jgi:hypothetical protein